MVITKIDQYNAYTTSHGLKEADRSSLSLFLGAEDPETQYGVVGMDHVALFLKDQKPYSFVIQPYAASLGAIDFASWDQLCQDHHLRLRILPSELGWYYPNRTICVEFTHDPELAQTIQTYKEINKRQSAWLKNTYHPKPKRY